MARQQKIQINQIPALLCYTTTAAKAAKKGTVLFYHGLTASKDIQQKELISLAQQGFLAVGVDNVGHGERIYPDFAQRFSSDNPNIENDFTIAVQKTVEEIPQTIDYLTQQQLIISEKIAIAGISMGGYIAYAAPVVERRIKVLTPILGSPCWKVEHSASPHRHPDCFYPVALLAQNAGADQSVPPENARNFYRQLQPFYQNAPHRLSYIEFANAGHFMPEHQWNELWQNTIDWLHKFLP